jgi:hypothetical protein
MFSLNSFTWFQENNKILSVAVRDQIDKYYVCVPYLMDITSHKMTTSDEHKFSENETKQVNVQVLRLTHHVSIDNDLIHFIKRFRPHPPEGVMYFTQKGWYTNSFNENPDLLLLVCMNFTFKVWYTSHLGLRKTILVVLVRDIKCYVAYVKFQVDIRLLKMKPMRLIHFSILSGFRNDRK